MTGETTTAAGRDVGAADPPPTATRRARRRPLAAGAAAALVVAAALAVLLDAAPVVRVVLVGAAVVVVARVGARRRGRGRLDAALLAVGGALVVAVLTGVVLDLLRIPLGPASWALALGAVGLLVLGADQARPVPEAPPVDRAGSRVVGPLLAWGAVVAVVLAVALYASARSLSSLDGPPFEASLGSVDGVTAEVVISSEAGTGPLEIRSDPGTGSTLSYPVVEVPAGGSTTTEVLVPAEGRTTITVSDPGRAQPLRTLVVDR